MAMKMLCVRGGGGAACIFVPAQGEIYTLRAELVCAHCGHRLFLLHEGVATARDNNTICPRCKIPDPVPEYGFDPTRFVPLYDDDVRVSDEDLYALPKPLEPVVVRP